MAAMHLRPLLLVSIVLGACFSEGPDGEDPTGDDTTSATDPSMTSTSTASTTTVDPVTTSPTSDVTSSDPTTTVSTVTTDDTTDPDSSSTSEPVAENVILDFTDDPCGAFWFGDLDNQVVECPTNADSPAAQNGYVFPVTDLDTVTIVSTNELFDSDAIVTRPPNDPDHIIHGRWQPIPIEPTDLFLGRALCIEDSLCDVQVSLGYNIEQGAPVVLATWNVSSEDEDGTDLEFELGDGKLTSGISYDFYLLVSSGASGAADAIVWDNPRIVRP